LTVKILAFGRIRETLGFGERTLVVRAAATPRDLFAELKAGSPALEPLDSSTRFARNGTLVDPGIELHDGDEVALLPPVGGG
jgi:molybdopterin converting factor small subunit